MKKKTCLEKPLKKYTTFRVPIEKEVTRNYKNGEEIIKNISYRLQLIDSTRFMASSLSNVVDNLSDVIHKVKCKCGHDDKSCGILEIKYEYCDCFIEFTNFKVDLIKYKCLCCKKNYQQKFHENLNERFINKY